MPGSCSSLHKAFIPLIETLLGCLLLWSVAFPFTSAVLFHSAGSALYKSETSSDSKGTEMFVLNNQIQEVMPPLHSPGLDGCSWGQPGSYFQAADVCNERFDDHITSTLWVRAWWCHLWWWASSSATRLLIVTHICLEKGNLCLLGGCCQHWSLRGHGAALQLFICCNEIFIQEWGERSPNFI